MKAKALIVASVLAVCGILAGFGQAAGGPGTRPFLRPGVETHTAPIGSLDVDADGRYILTASGDKTARLWDARDGTLLRVLRPPIDRGTEGQLYACALSPDGRLAAVAGSTGLAWSPAASVYVFDTSTGVMVRAIRGLPYSIHDLEFSLNGRYLAAALWRDGVRIIDTASWEVAHSLAGHGDVCSGVSFDRTGRLAVVCFDGTVRLYDAAFASSQLRRTAAGRWPRCAAFSPDGTRIAVGFHDTNRIEILSGENLDLLYEPQPRGSQGDAHFSVCWSNDGETLFAGGWYGEGRAGTWRLAIESWGKAGTLAGPTYPVGTDTIAGIKVLPGGDLAYCSGAGEVGRLDPQGKAVFARRGETSRYNNQREALRISGDGTVVGFTPMDGLPYTFDAKRSRLLQEASTDPLARTAAQGITISNWGRGAATPPVLNGVEVSHMARRERCHSVSISSSGRDILLGADWNIYCLDPEGRLRWKIPAASAWAVNIAANDELFVAAYADGTIGWHQLSTGALLLTLFVHADGQRWLAWTPNGYFAASAGGDALAGWHFNNGHDRAALFYPLSRFAMEFHRPEVIRRVLELRDVEQALAEVNRSRGRPHRPVELEEFLPPVVTILAPRDGSLIEAERLDLQALVSTVPRHPATEIRVLVDGRPAEEMLEGPTRAESDREQRRQLSLTLPSGTYQVEVAAKNQAGFGDPAEVRVVYRKKELPKQNLNVLAVGISRYPSTAPPLPYAANDARDLAASLQEQQGRLYQEVAVRLLTDGAATREAITQGLRWLRSRAGAEDVSIVFLGGREVRGSDGEAFLLPADADLAAVDTTGFRASVLAGMVRELPGRVVVLLDICHRLEEGTPRPGAAEPGGSTLAGALAASESGAIVLSACSDGQHSQRRPEWTNGAFAAALLAGLGGKADYTGDGRVSLNELEIYVRKSVKTLTGGLQTPFAVKPLAARDFPLAAAARDR